MLGQGITQGSTLLYTVLCTAFPILLISYISNSFPLAALVSFVRKAFRAGNKPTLDDTLLALTWRSTSSRHYLPHWRRTNTPRHTACEFGFWLYSGGRHLPGI